jgi:threonine/homoserine/homoserine lactone efflux protein
MCVRDQQNSLTKQALSYTWSWWRAGISVRRGRDRTFEASTALGAALASWTVTVLTTVSGSRLSRFLKLKLLNATSGLLFAGIGIDLIAAAL